MKELISNYEKMKRKMIEEYISFQSNNNISEYEGYIKTSFWGELTKPIFTNNDVNAEPKEEILLKVENGIVIPSIIEFYEADSFTSVWDFCDSIDGDIMVTYETIANINEGIRKEYIYELGLHEEAAYESSILYIWNIESKNEQYLDMFLTLFDDFLVQMPSRYSQIAVVLIDKNKQSNYIDIFKVNNWKIKTISKQCALAFRRI